MLIKTLFAAFSVCGTIEAGIIDNLISTIWGDSKQKEPDVGILIAHDVPGVVLEVKGKYKIFDPLTNNFISTRFIGKRKFIQAMNDGIKWGEEFPTVHQIQIVPDDAKTTVLVDGIEYKGLITVFDIGGTISVVNDIPLDDYVKAVLNPHYSEGIPRELAAALVIAERTNAYEKLRNPPSRYFTFDKDSISYQGYAPQVRGEGFGQAVDSTRNMILVKDGAPFSIDLFKEGKLALGKLTFEQANELAQKGGHAAQILSNAFPGSMVTLTNFL